MFDKVRQHLRLRFYCRALILTRARASVHDEKTSKTFLFPFYILWSRVHASSPVRRPMPHSYPYGLIWTKVIPSKCWKIGPKIDENHSILPLFCSCRPLPLFFVLCLSSFSCQWSATSLWPTSILLNLSLSSGCSLKFILVPIHARESENGQNVAEVAFIRPLELRARPVPCPWASPLMRSWWSSLMILIKFSTNWSTLIQLVII